MSKLLFHNPRKFAQRGETVRAGRAKRAYLDLIISRLPVGIATSKPGDTTFRNPPMRGGRAWSDCPKVMTAKVGVDLATPLLGPDATQATGRSILGVPLLSSKAVADRAGWLIPKDRCFLVLRNNPSVIADRSAMFGSDPTAIRCVLRAAFAFVHEDAVIEVVMDSGS